MRERRPVILALVALVLVAVLMRPAVTAVGPVIDRISADTGIPVPFLGSLSTAVLVMWAVVCPFAYGLGRRMGLGGAVLAAVVLLAVGVVIRSLPGSTAWLWIGTLLIGIAIAIGNVLLPAIVKRDFPLRVPLMMSVYSALLGGAGAVASGLAVPLADLAGEDAGAGWRLSLAITGAIVAPIAIAVWAFAHRHEMRAARAARPGRAPRMGIWRDRLAWQIAGYMGLQSTAFFVLVTWISTMSIDTGRGAALAGVDVMVFQIFSLIGSLAIAVALRGRWERITPAALPALGVVATVGLMLRPDLIGVWGVPLGLFCGASLTVSLTLIAHRSRDHGTSSALSGMTQSVGYGIAAIGPALFGGAHALTGSWTIALVLLLATMVGQGVLGIPAARDRFVLDR